MKNEKVIEKLIKELNKQHTEHIKFKNDIATLQLRVYQEINKIPMCECLFTRVCYNNGCWIIYITYTIYAQLGGFYLPILSDSFDPRAVEDVIHSCKRKVIEIVGNIECGGKSYIEPSQVDAGHDINEPALGPPEYGTYHISYPNQENTGAATLGGVQRLRHPPLTAETIYRARQVMDQGDADVTHQEPLPAPLIIRGESPMAPERWVVTNTITTGTSGTYGPQ